LTNFIKESTRHRGKRKTKREDPSSNQKFKNLKGLQRGKGTNFVPKPPLVARSILKKERKGNLTM
jgi:hypothetical protein